MRSFETKIVIHFRLRERREINCKLLENQTQKNDYTHGHGIRKVVVTILLSLRKSV